MRNKFVHYKTQFRMNRSLDKPKSVSFICPIEVISKLSGFKSRCTIPYEWRYSRASTTSAVYILAISKGKVQIFLSNVRTSPPFISFIKKMAGSKKAFKRYIRYLTAFSNLSFNKFHYHTKMSLCLECAVHRNHEWVFGKSHNISF